MQTKINLYHLKQNIAQTIKKLLRPLIRHHTSNILSIINNDPKNPFIASPWHVIDIKGCADDAKISITNADAYKILKTVYTTGDADYGINWESIRTAIENFKADQKENK